MSDFISDFIGFDRDFFHFGRDIRDTRPYQIFKDKDSITIIHNVLGIDEKDLKIDIENEESLSYLTISGETVDKYEHTYSVNSRFSLDAEKYEKVEYELHNGMLYITLVKKPIVKPQISISKK